MAETREESQTKVLTEKKQTSAAEENQTGINAEKKSASIPEKQTIVTYTDDELVSFKVNMVSENTKKSTSTSVRRLQSWFKEKLLFVLLFSGLIVEDLTTAARSPKKRCHFRYKWTLCMTKE